MTNNMYIEQAIRKAIEGGLNDHKGYEFNDVRWIGGNTRTVIDLVHHYAGGESMICTSAEELLLNPSFWQSLGKAGVFGTWRRAKEAEWKDYWHRFIDHLAAGRDPESFFKQILTDQ